MARVTDTSKPVGTFTDTTLVRVETSGRIVFAIANTFFETMECGRCEGTGFHGDAMEERER